MVIRFDSTLKTAWFFLLCTLFASCDEVPIRDFVNDHVIAASYVAIRYDENSAQRLPSGEIVVNSATKLTVILSNPRNTRYEVTWSGKGSSLVESAVQDPADPSVIYVTLNGTVSADEQLTPALLGGTTTIYKNATIMLHLTPPAAKAPPDDIFLPVYYPMSEIPGREDDRTEETKKNLVVMVSSMSETPQTIDSLKAAGSPLPVERNGKITLTASGADLDGASWWVLLDEFVLFNNEIVTGSSGSYALSVTIPHVSGKTSYQITVIMSDGSFTYLDGFEITVPEAVSENITDNRG